MAIVVKSSEEIDKIRKSSRIVAEVLEAMKQYVKPGVSTGKLDAVAEEIIRSHGATPSFKNYHGYPASICASVDDCVIHGIPSEKQILKQLKDEKNAIILAHNYQPKEIQEIADFLGDSLELCMKAAEIEDKDLVIFCGVDFMAETAYILNPDKKIVIPDLEAECPMAYVT